MDYPFLSKFWMFIAKKYSTFNEFIFFSEYSVLLRITKFSHIYGDGCKIFLSTDFSFYFHKKSEFYYFKSHILDIVPDTAVQF